MAWTYDSIGNILTKSQDGSSMTYAYDSVTHKLDTVTAGGTVYNYSYDAYNYPQKLDRASRWILWSADREQGGLTLHFRGHLSKTQ